MNQQQKAALVEATERHEREDALIGGLYGVVLSDGRFRGCSVGCLAHEADPGGPGFGHHQLVAEHYGYPLWVVDLQEFFFECGLKEIHVEIARALVPGTDWQELWHAFMHRLLKELVLPRAEAAQPVVRTVVELHAARNTNAEDWEEALTLVKSALCFDAVSRSARSALQATKWCAAEQPNAGRSWTLGREVVDVLNSSAIDEQTARRVLMQLLLEECRAQKPRDRTRFRDVPTPEKANTANQENTK